MKGMKRALVRFSLNGSTDSWSEMLVLLFFFSLFAVSLRMPDPSLRRLGKKQQSSGSSLATKCHAMSWQSGWQITIRYTLNMHT